jgi:hypothetical protein
MTLLQKTACLFCLALSAVAHATEYHGRVLFGAVPIPGAVVTLTRGTKTLSTTTDSQGLYLFPDLEDGAWKISVELRGFTKMDSDVTVAANTPTPDLSLKLLSLDQLIADAQSAPTAPEPKPLQPHPAAPSAAKKPGNAKTQTAATGPDAAPAPPAEDTEKSSDGLLINGSVNNASTSPFSLSPAFGNRRANTRSLYNGSFVAVADNSAFDARPYSITGLQIPKAEQNRITTGFTFGGPIRVPPLFYHGPNFFIAYQWTRNSDATTDQILVPTLAQRNLPGDPIALKLLQYYPLPDPNIANSSPYNFEKQVLNSTHQDLLQTRLDKSIGHRDQLYGTFGFTSVRASSDSVFNFNDTTDTLGIRGNINWQHRYAHQLFVLLGYEITRQRTELIPQFANRMNVSGAAGIVCASCTPGTATTPLANGGNNQDPRDWGPPTLIFSGGIASLTDGISESNRNRTDASSAKVTTTRGRHTIIGGGEFRRQEYNQLQQSNPRGTYTFTGAATSGSTATANGADFADFLAGVPDTSAIAYGNADKYFRQSIYALYATDDWRVRPELTINAGIRWEYGSPMNELKGRLVNLDLTPNFSTATPVLGNAPRGATTGQSYPNSLIRPDHSGIEPRIALSWRPLPASTLVIRAGYGIYDDTSIYLGAVESMAQQSPLSTSLQVSNGPNCKLRLANGFQNCAGTTADTFAVDPNLRVGNAQVWQVSAQQDLPGALVMTATYQGTKGTHGAQEFLPNTYPIGATSPCPLCPIGFIYRTSGGNSEREAGQLQVRRRLRAGFTATAQYTFAKAVDNDSQLGGGGHVTASSASSSGTSSSTTSSSPMIAQNWLNLRGERSRSSFDQRHLLTGQLQYTSGMGKGGGTLLSGWRGRLLKDWTVSTQFSFGTGLPETPIYYATVPGTGVSGTIRPNRTGAALYMHTPGTFLNSAAYTAPVSGQWGTAGRNSITGPGTFTLNGSLARTFRLKDPYSIDVRVDANNYLNHITFTSYNTTINSTFGAPTGPEGMRTLQLTGRLRF